MRNYSMVMAATGGPDVLQMQETPIPQVEADEILVETAAIGLNFIETYQRSGIYPVDLPAVLGSEASGKVVAVGEAVKGYRVGDEIITAAGNGTYSKHFTVQADKAAKVPAGMDLRVAAAVPLQGITAHYLANSSSNPGAGETVLVHAGAGGVGLLLTQILKAKGVRVITTASTDAKRQLSREAGADHAIGYENFVSVVRDLTDGRGVSVVYDGVGKTTFDASLEALAVRGLMVLFGGASGQVPPFDLQRLNALGSLTITRPTAVHFQRSKDEIAWRYGELFELYGAGKLRFRVGEEFALKNVGDAHVALESRRTTGKVLLIP